MVSADSHVHGDVSFSSGSINGTQTGLQPKWQSSEPNRYHSYYAYVEDWFDRSDEDFIELMTKPREPDIYYLWQREEII